MNRQQRSERPFLSVDNLAAIVLVCLAIVGCVLGVGARQAYMANQMRAEAERVMEAEQAAAEAKRAAAEVRKEQVEQEQLEQVDVEQVEQVSDKN